MKQLVEVAIRDAVQACFADGTLSSGEVPLFTIEKPAHAEHGDVAVNVAMMLAKPERKGPRQIAETIIAHLPQDTDNFARVEIAGPGFINFFIAPVTWQRTLAAMASQGEQYGNSSAGAGQRAQVEFVSANPTGPLHIGHGRGAAIGDVICRLLAASGWDVTREFYYNDAGQQIANLALSVQSRCLGIEPGDPRWPADGYQGDYIKDVARAYLAGETVHADDRHVTAAADAHDLDAIRCFAVACLRREQDEDLRAFDVHFDVYSLESNLYAEGRVDAVVQQLITNGHAYEQDGALWLRTTDYGDDKDRVMRKSDGGYTYFVPDVAYHLQKWQRGFTRVVNEQGADHHSTVTRVRAGLQALDVGIPSGWPEYVLHQMVTVMRGGEEVKISKRAGSYVTLRDLIDEVGRDATRYFFVMRRPDSQLVFDIDLAKQKSLDNPVYYVQYAHARIHSIFEMAAQKGIDCACSQPEVQLLSTDDDLRLIKILNEFPAIVAASAQSFEPHRVTTFLQELAGEFHSFYNRNRVINEDVALTMARLFLLQRVAQVLRNGLGLLGVSAPERM